MVGTGSCDELGTGEGPRQGRQEKGHAKDGRKSVKARMVALGQKRQDKANHFAKISAAYCARMRTALIKRFEAAERSDRRLRGAAA